MDVKNLKTENIMLTVNNDVKIIDFGLTVKLESITPRKRSHNYCGTPAYMAPEIFMDEVDNAQKVDIWSIGVIFYIMLSGSEPFHSNESDITALKQLVCRGQYKKVENISQQASELLRSLLNADPNCRPTAEELLNHPYLQDDETQNNPDNTLDNSAGQNMETAQNGEEKLIASPLDKTCMKQMKRLFPGMKKDELVRRVNEWNYDEFTATYLILLEKKRRGQLDEEDHKTCGCFGF